MIARIQKSMKDKDQGFTLIELLVVMIIIGILAAIAIPVFLNQRKKAVDTSIKADLKSYATAVETAAIDTQKYPAALPTGLKKTGDNEIAYTVDGTGANFCLSGFNSNANANVIGNAYWYVSSDGGLKPEASDKPGGCP